MLRRVLADSWLPGSDIARSLAHSAWMIALLDPVLSVVHARMSRHGLRCIVLAEVM